MPKRSTKKANLVKTKKKAAKKPVIAKRTKVVKLSKNSKAKPAIKKKAAKPIAKRNIKIAKAKKPAKKSTRVAVTVKNAAKKTPASKVKSLSSMKKTAKKPITTISKKTKETLTPIPPIAKKTKTPRTMSAENHAAIPSTSSQITQEFVHIVPDENYMNDEQHAHFRDILLQWKKQLLEEMERTVHHMQDDAANFADPNDRATQEEEFSLELRARDRERKLIKKIEEALQRIDNNEYGYCEACGVEIGVKRLEARPTATLCIDCKTIDEIREKHYS